MEATWRLGSTGSSSMRSTSTSCRESRHRQATLSSAHDPFPAVSRFRSPRGKRWNRPSKAQLGSKRAKQIWEPRPGRLKVDRPLELIQIDHTPVDVLVLTDDRQTILGRPWLTVAIDVATRCVLGIYLSMDAPSAVSVSLCIEHRIGADGLRTH